MRWRIYYDDGTHVSSQSALPGAAPPFGVLCIVQPDPEVGRVVLYGWDWYYWVASEGGWWGSDLHGVLDRLLHGLELTALKQGRLASASVFQSVLKTAIADPDFPRKSALRKGESPGQR